MTTSILHIVLARKPIEKSTVAENCQKFGVGGLNIDECRIDVSQGDIKGGSLSSCMPSNHGKQNGSLYSGGFKRAGINRSQGRFPANVVLAEGIEGFPEVHGVGTSVDRIPSVGDFGIVYHGKRVRLSHHRFGDSGNVSRFFFNYGEQK